MKRHPPSLFQPPSRQALKFPLPSAKSLTLQQRNPILAAEPPTSCGFASSSVPHSSKTSRKNCPPDSELGET